MRLKWAHLEIPLQGFSQHQGHSNEISFDIDESVYKSYMYLNKATQVSFGKVSSQITKIKNKCM